MTYKQFKKLFLKITNDTIERNVGVMRTIKIADLPWKQSKDKPGTQRREIMRISRRHTMVAVHISSDTTGEFMTFDEAKTILENDDHFLPLDPDDESYGVDGIFVSTEPKPEFQDIVMKALEVDLHRPLNISQDLMSSCSVMKNAYHYETDRP